MKTGRSPPAVLFRYSCEIIHKYAVMHFIDMLGRLRLAWDRRAGEGTVAPRMIQGEEGNMQIGIRAGVPGATSRNPTAINATHSSTHRSIHLVSKTRQLWRRTEHP